MANTTPESWVAHQALDILNRAQKLNQAFRLDATIEVKTRYAMELVQRVLAGQLSDYLHDQTLDSARSYLRNAEQELREFPQDVQIEALKKLWYEHRDLRADITDLANAIKRKEVYVLVPDLLETVWQNKRDREECESEQAAEGAWLREAEMGSAYEYEPMM
jgi:predicted transcriptional regulator